MSEDQLLNRVECQNNHCPVYLNSNKTRRSTALRTRAKLSNDKYIVMVCTRCLKVTKLKRSSDD